MVARHLLLKFFHPAPVNHHVAFFVEPVYLVCDIGGGMRQHISGKYDGIDIYFFSTAVPSPFSPI